MFLEILDNNNLHNQHNSSSSSSTPTASYFDIVHIPGYIDGNLKNVRETVQKTLSLYHVNSLLYLNPRQESQIRKEGIINAQVCFCNFYRSKIFNIYFFYFFVIFISQEAFFNFK